MSMNFHLAPPSKSVDGLLSVPIDIESIHAVFTFDGAAQTATADATVVYTVGPTGGNPIFDLRQTPMQAWLDGRRFRWRRSRTMTSAPAAMPNCA